MLKYQVGNWYIMENKIKIVQPRDDIEIHLDNGIVLSGPRGSQIGDFIKTIKHDYDQPIVGAIVNGELRELGFRVYMDAKVTPVFLSDADGARMYRRSLTFLLEAAFSELFPTGTLTIDHSVASGGFYCQVFGILPLTNEDLSKLEGKMRSLIAEDLPFVKQEVPLEEALSYFRSINADDKIKLMAHRQKNYLTLYSLGNHKDYHHGYMVPSTGYLKWFGLLLTNGGFTLRFPQRKAPTEILPLPDYPKLLAAFRRYGDWLNRLGISSVGALNDTIENGRIREVILVSEAFHDQHVNEIATQIASRYHQIRVVLISGPSCSGKTTFSKRLSIALLARGICPFPLEMDNYFVDREMTPKDENGEYNFETIGALDTKLLVADLTKLINGNEVQIPKYDFRKGLREPGEVVQLQNDEIILLEGIHGLNPNLIPNFPNERLYRIYVSALTQLNLDRHNRVSTTDTRLIRRITRDARERGYSALRTIQRWESVRLGEKKYIFPYQENADVMFNSALVYEVAVLKPFVEPLLLQVPFGTPEYIEAKRILSFLEWFLTLDSDLIPDNSILREFTGNSILKNFSLWQSQE
jgi:uridine kinase